MAENPILSFIEELHWLQPLQEKTEQLVKKAYESRGEPGQKVKNALHGVWLKHPLHAAITDVPVGSWTAALVLDLLQAAGREQYAAGADAAIMVGLAGALASAASGLTDWSEVHGEPQRIGAVHGLLNVAATLLYGGSYFSRKSGNRALGRGLSYAGYALVLASAWLGGELSYAKRIGADNSIGPDEELPKEYTPVCAESDLPEGQLKKANVSGIDIVLYRNGQRIFALGGKCTHLGGPLWEGKVHDDVIQCPWHGSEFCMHDGSIVNGPATHAQSKFDVTVQNGQVLVRVS